MCRVIAIYLLNARDLFPGYNRDSRVLFNEGRASFAKNLDRARRILIVK